MPFVERLWWLCVAHAITDALLQDPQITSIGTLKNPASPLLPGHWPYWLFLHGILNGLGVYWITGSLWLMMGETLLHSLIDVGKMQHWYTVHVDQLFHFSCKVAWALLA